MTTRPRDTTPEAWHEVEERLRRMTPAERIRRAVALSTLAQDFALAQIRRKHPAETAHEHRVRLAARTVDPATMKAAFGYPDGRAD